MYNKYEERDITGCCLLIFAPGNFIRSSVVCSGIMSIAYRGYGQISAFCNWLLFLISRTRCYLFGQYLSVIIMIASPTYTFRTTFVILIMTFLTNFQHLKQNRYQTAFIYMI